MLTGQRDHDHAMLGISVGATFDGSDARFPDAAADQHIIGHLRARGREAPIIVDAALIDLIFGQVDRLEPPGGSVVPGTIDSQRGLPGVPERPAHRAAPPPIGRRGEPEEIARCVVFLASDEAGLITGATLSANGGQYFV